jgi:hypothetical protein
MLQILVVLLAFFHPFYVSVTEIKHNERSKGLEISSKIFYDDLEAVLEKDYKVKVDILNPVNRANVDAIIADYFNKHFHLVVEGRKVPLKYLGYEIEDEAAWCYFEVPKVARVKNIRVVNNVLFEQHASQINMLHVIIKGVRRSTKLDNPQDKADFQF